MRVRWRGVWLVAVGAVLGSCVVGRAQTVYKWTDESGVVHFSDSAPPAAKSVEELHLPVPPAARPRAPEAGEQPEGSGGAQTSTPPAKAEGAAASVPSGPARIILVSRQNPRTAPSAMHIIGAVKNVGGADARHVAITISAVDSTQGTPCLREEVPVIPSTLPPGESGNFDFDVDSPCLFGDPNIDVVPSWD
jgi:hypothetical protein